MVVEEEEEEEEEEVEEEGTTHWQFMMANPECRLHYLTKTIQLIPTVRLVEVARLLALHITRTAM